MPRRGRCCNRVVRPARRPFDALPHGGHQPARAGYAKIVHSLHASSQEPSTVSCPSVTAMVERQLTSVATEGRDRPSWKRATGR